MESVASGQGTAPEPHHDTPRHATHEFIAFLSMIGREAPVLRKQGDEI